MHTHTNVSITKPTSPTTHFQILTQTQFSSPDFNPTLLISFYFINKFMANFRGFRMRHKLLKFLNWSLRHRTKNSGYKRLSPSNCTAKAVSKICSFGRCLKRGAKELCFIRSDPGYIRMGQENPVCVPKGHLAIYVGEKLDDAHRILVPVIFFNHPLFGDLLKEAEKVYGYNHSGGIQIPCRISDFENVQTKIIAGGSGGS